MLTTKIWVVLIATILALCSISTITNAQSQTTTHITTEGIIVYPTVISMLFVDENKIRNTEEPIFLLGCNVRGRAYNPKLDDRYDDWHTDRSMDAETIKSYGFNAIRLVIYWEALETSNDSTQFSYNETYIELIKETVNAYNENGIYVILSLTQHSSVNELGKFIPTLGNDADYADEFYSDDSNSSAREHLVRLWLKISESFVNWSGVAGYDLLNEPHRSEGLLSNQEVADLWFNIVDYVIDGLRAHGDEHIVFVNFSPWARYAGFMNRRVSDDNVVYSPHFYQGHDEEAVSVAYNDIETLTNDFENDINSKMMQFNVPFVMEEQGWSASVLAEGDAKSVWLQNAITVHKTSPLMQGWFYWCYISYNGDVNGGGWQGILTQNMG